MSKIQEAYARTLTSVDAIKSLLEQLGNGKSFKDLNFKFNAKGIKFSNWNATVSANPFDLLVMLLEKFMTYNEIVEWLANKLVYELPAIELGVKGVLLSMLKAEIDCNTDPRIPERFRLPLNKVQAQDKSYADIIGDAINGLLSDGNPQLIYDDIRKRGALIPIQSIDFLNLLYFNPLNEAGQHMYFGTKKYYALEDSNGEEIAKFYTYNKAKKKAKDIGYLESEIIDKSEVKTVWELCRAEDFNAFLWFVTHKCSFVAPITLSSGDTFFENIGDKNVLEVFEGFCELNDSSTPKPYLPGDLLSQSKTFNNRVINSTVISLCISSTETEQKPSVSYLLEKAKNGFETWNINNDENEFSRVVYSYSSFYDTNLSILYGDPSSGGVYYHKIEYGYGNNEEISSITYNINKMVFIETFEPNNDIGGNVTSHTSKYRFSGNTIIDNSEITPTNPFLEEDENYAAYSSFKLLEEQRYNAYKQRYESKTGRSLEKDIEEWKNLKEEEKDKRGDLVSKLKNSVNVTNNLEVNNIKPLELPMTKEEFDNDSIKFTPKYYSAKFVPVSCNYKSANFYVNRKDYFTRNLSEKAVRPRDYEKEFAICNLEYINGMYHSHSNVSTSKGIIKMSIMPKPYIYLGGNEKSVLPKRILFNSKGEPKLLGKYTVKVDDGKSTPLKFNNGKVAGIKKDVLSDGGDVINRLFISDKEYFLEDTSPEALAVSLRECYPGLTVYEFNFDFIMGMRLFDASVVADKLIKSIANIQVGLGVSKYETEYQMRIAKIIDNIIKKSSSEVSDCFFTFSNDEYDQMLTRSEEKRANLYSFDSDEHKTSVIDVSEIDEILKGCNENVSKVEQTEVLTRAINQATASITAEMLPSDKYSFKFNFVLEMVRALAAILVETLFSPKVMLILEFNRQLLGDGDINHDLSFEEVIKTLEKLLVQIVKSLIDMICKIILEEILKRLTVLLGRVAEVIIAEQLDAYLTLIRELVDNCLFVPNFNANNLASVLDDVNYADIDDNNELKTDEC